MLKHRFNLTEIALGQAVIYLLIWMWNDHVATLLSLSFSAIAFAVLLLSLISELLERSKVPRWYYWVMFVSGVVPIIIGSFFMLLKKGELDWMHF
jgi:hypothetical protein